MKNKLFLVMDLVVICSVLVVVAAIAFMVKGLPPATPDPSTPVAFDYSAFNSKLVPMTSAQRTASIKGIVGTKVLVTGTVADVKDDGQINLSVDNCSTCVLIHGVPASIAQSLTRKQTITVTGQIGDDSIYLSQLLLTIKFESIAP